MVKRGIREAEEGRAQAEVQRAVIDACDALLFKSALNRDKAEDRFILKSVLNELIWKFTETHEHPGKYLGCPWWSEKALAVFDSKAQDWKKQVALDHVVERRTLNGLLLQASSIGEVRTILDGAATCVLLRGEHKDLVKGAQGWDRYRDVVRVEGPLVRKRKISLNASKKKGSQRSLKNV